ncbi:MAG TPA: hypothetical protein VER12_04925 [Polyangiaceae bacterium]|nr:hypothetical protein [Polyangiaceae bacterium]HYQ29964.1 hypothetical protein [Polyangiaceae bacterium]
MPAIIRSAAIFGLWAVVAPASAVAQPTGVSAVAAGQPDPNQALPPSRTVKVDEYPPPSAGRNLMLVGLGSTVAWYGAALGVSYAVDDPAMAKDLKIPFAGPWMSLTHTGCGGASTCNTFLVVLGAIATTLDGIGQASGLALTAEGLFMPTREPKRARAALRRKDFDWRPTFDAGKNTVSFGVLGVF